MSVVSCERAPPKGENEEMQLLWWTQVHQQRLNQRYPCVFKHVTTLKLWKPVQQCVAPVPSPFWNWISTFRYCLSKSITTAFMWPRMPLRYLSQRKTVWHKERGRTDNISQRSRRTVTKNNIYQIKWILSVGAICHFSNKMQSMTTVSNSPSCWEIEYDTHFCTSWTMLCVFIKKTSLSDFLLRVAAWLSRMFAIWKQRRSTT